MNIITLSDARRLGRKRYFNGKPCPHGHTCERLVSNMGCVICAYGRFKEYYGGNKSKLAENVKAWRLSNAVKNLDTKMAWEHANKDRKAAWDKRSHEKHRASRLSKMAAYREVNGAKINEKKRTWQKTNLAKVVAQVSEREQRKRKAVPLWADRIAMEIIYANASAMTLATGVKYHVDHYVPLRSKVVCGLHVQDNLRVVTAAENLKKGAKWQP